MPPISNYVPSDEIYELNKLQIEQGKVPSIFYKYWSIGSVLRFLETGMIMFNRYSEFNDPFECQAHIDTSNTKAEWYKFLLQNRVPDRIAAVKSKKMAKNKMLAGHHIKASIEAVYSETGIFCMSTKNDNLLMWAHYGDEHKGACIEFDVTKNLKVFCPIRKVQYNSDYRSYNYLNNQGEAFRSMEYKSRDWEYEDEYRVLHNGGYGLMSVKKDAVKTIIFGCRTDKKDIEAVKKALKEYGYTKTKYKVAKMNTMSYKIDIP